MIINDDNYDNKSVQVVRKNVSCCDKESNLIFQAFFVKFM